MYPTPINKCWCVRRTVYCIFWYLLSSILSRITRKNSRKIVFFSIITQTH